MSSPAKPFAFKKFEVVQSRSAMRVGTDAVLLAAWVRLGKCEHVLDVGTGTGVIALICAQRCSSANIEAIEIDEGSAEDAMENFTNSPWKDRMKVHLGDFLKIVTSEKFDLIISNPPYFTHSLRSPDPVRNAARHDDYLPSDAFMRHASGMLKQEGKVALIFPKSELERWVLDASLVGLKPERICHVFTLAHKDAARVMIEFTFQAESEPEMESILIQKSPGEPSDAYKLLTTEFYTKW
ncbi:MAG: tRNA1(Val) (adenine(37)-N6)-methyltransferase [Flavobacteriales bacterium]